MIEICPLEQSDFNTFKSWIKNEEELFQFAGLILSFPVTDDQLLGYINDSKRIAYKVRLIETGEMIGSAELNFENALPRLSRILIGNKSYRNKGFGRSLINKLLEKLFFEYDVQQVDLNVFDWNEAAIKCYKSVGFVVNTDIYYEHNYKNIKWTAINMTISKDRWNQNEENK